ncbi:hypothetical protein Q8F55_001589 [Vanrija albida]|uniref:GDP/GTP exchange factor Sec2 N-terminal domain-containing protein n=1 Tax=Vanrija albida TaxID=181172 RepID=A0ABR3QGG5_9TREE
MSPGSCTRRNGWPTLISRLKYHCGTEEWTVPSPCLWCELDGALCTVRSPTVVLGPVPDDESLLLLTTIRCGPFPASRTIEASDASAAPPHTEAGRVSHPSQAPLTLPTPKDTDSTPTDFLAPPPAAPLLTSGLPARAAAQNARAAISAQAKPAPLRLRRSKRRRAPSVSSAGSSVVEVEPPDQVVALKAKVLRLEAELASVRGAVERVRTDHAGLAARAKKTVTALTAANGLLQHVAKSEAEHSAECTAARERTSAQYAAVEHAVHTATEDITALKAAGAAAAKVPSPQPHADPSVAFRIASLEAQVHGLLSERAARQS